MAKFLFIAILFAIKANCQLQYPEEKLEDQSTLLLPYENLNQEKYRLNRRTERVPLYRYEEETEEEIYRPGKTENDNNYRYRHQQAVQARTQKDYEEILRQNHLARQRVQAKKQGNPQPAAEQYLKEVNPTTTSYQRPNNYLLFSEQNTEVKNQNEEVKQEPYRYVLQPEQKPVYAEYQVEETTRRVPFNLVAYQKALITRQRLLEQQEDPTPKSSIYVAQNIPKKSPKKQKTRVTPQRQEYEYYTPQEAIDYQIEEPLGYRNKEIESVRPTKQRTATRAPPRKVKYTEEPPEDYQTDLKQRQEEIYEEAPINYRRPASRPPTKPLRYQDTEETTQRLQYHQEVIPKRQLQYQPQPRYLPRQFQEESQQFSRYQPVDLAYQPSYFIPVRYIKQVFREQ